MSRRRSKGKKGGFGRRGYSSPRPLPRDGAQLLGAQTVEGPSWSYGEPYVLRHISAAAARKVYICPGCHNQIMPGQAHIVAWPRDSGRQAEDRRHWHRHCWDRR